MTGLHRLLNVISIASQSTKMVIVDKGLPLSTVLIIHLGSSLDCIFL